MGPTDLGKHCTNISINRNPTVFVILNVQEMFNTQGIRTVVYTSIHFCVDAYEYGALHSHSETTEMNTNTFITVY